MTGSYIGGHQVAGPTPPSTARYTPVNGTGTWLSLVPAVEPLSPAGEYLVKEVRALPAPFAVKVGGQSAQLVDSKASIFGRLPLAAGLIGLVTITVLFLFTGSVIVPIKAVVLNLLSLSATFGAMVWIFQEGHLASLLHFTATGVIDTTTPILMFCIAFGLSMDYEVFLLSRIKEEHDRTGDNVASVALGLEHTGRIVTAAAALLALVFLAFATSQVAFIKLFGIGLAMAVLVDATLVRAALVPAFMRLAGEANWWAPAPLKRVYKRFGISEAPADSNAPEASVSSAARLDMEPAPGDVTSIPRLNKVQYRLDVLYAIDGCVSQDEAMAIVSGLSAGGYFEYHGEVYDLPPVKISPTPTEPLPIHANSSALGHTLPRSFLPAHAQMAASASGRRLLGDAFVTGFCAAKTVEYDSYLYEVGAWERRFLGPQA